ncbi:MAG: UrcA family protein [Caulobacterales bacterium]|nr:UrcA family protein [Caulobacterales bacterium]
MTNFAAKISTAAMLALAALPIGALASAAHAETRVHVADLNLTTPQGMAAFNQRAHNAASTYCAEVVGLSARASCRNGVKAELSEKAGAIRDAQMAQAAQTFAAR